MSSPSHGVQRISECFICVPPLEDSYVIFLCGFAQHIMRLEIHPLRRGRAMGEHDGSGFS